MRTRSGHKTVPDSSVVGRGLGILPEGPLETYGVESRMKVSFDSQ